jgi:hypothetical protein
METQQPQQQETKTSREEIDFESLSTEAKLGTLIEETEVELKNIEKLLGRLSKKQMERILLITLSYPLKQLRPGHDEAERYVSNVATKIEHLKILTIKIASDLDNEQKESANGKETLQQES